MQRAQTAFATGKTRDVDFRIKQLKQCMRMFDECAAEMANALAADLRKHKQEAVVAEIDFLKNETLNFIYNLKEWAAPRVTTQIHG